MCLRCIIAPHESPGTGGKEKAYTHARTHTRVHTHTHARVHTHSRTHTHTHTHTHTLTYPPIAHNLIIVALWQILRCSLAAQFNQRNVPVYRMPRMTHVTCRAHLSSIHPLMPYMPCSSQLANVYVSLERLHSLKAAPSLNMSSLRLKS
jgi:hypothetical protein